MDCRDIAANTPKWYKEIDKKNMIALVEVSEACDDCDEKDSCPNCETGNGCSIEVSVSVKFEVCSVCRGKGSHVNPSIDSHGIGQEEFDADPDFYRDYRRGFYDVQCYECGGHNVVPVVDESRTNKRDASKVAEHIKCLRQMAADDVRAARMGY